MGRPKGAKDKAPRKRGNGKKIITAPGDNSKFVKHALASLNLPPLNINDIDAVAERCEWYFDHCVEDDIRPGVAGLCNALGIDRTTFYDWCAGHRRSKNPKFAFVMKKCKAIMEEYWEMLMLQGKINPASGIFLGKNHFGYRDVVEQVTVKADPLGEATSPAELEKRYMTAVNPDSLPAVTDKNEENT